MSQQVLNFIQIILNECESLGEPGIRNCDVNIRLSPGKHREREFKSIDHVCAHHSSSLFRFFSVTKQTSLHKGDIV